MHTPQQINHIYRFLISVAAVVIAGIIPVCAQDPTKTSADTIALSEVAVTVIKQSSFLGDQPVAYTEVNADEIKRRNILTVKNVSEMAPNFYIPSYGSRMTSSVYVRGLGARMDQPVVGLSVDNVPFMNKDNYDFDLVDVTRIEVLRGPQSTLYGRNTMGGQVNIYTLSPFDYQGGRVMAEGGNGPNMRMSIGYYQRFSPRLAMSWSGYFNYQGGYYKNMYQNTSRVGRERTFSGRWKTVARFTPRLTLENVASVNIARQGGYPYEYVHSGEINYNDTCFYRRNSITDGLTIRWQHERFTLSGITSFQLIDDNMTLDQDFLPLDYFTLTQKRKEWALTQDIVIRGGNATYSWLGGLFGFVRHTSMSAPVTFKHHGIATLIEEKRNEINPEYPIRWDEDQFDLGSRFTYPVRGAAVYHRSTLNLGQFTFEAGLRLDYEHASLSYRSECNTSYTVMHRQPDGTLKPFLYAPVDIDDHGHLSHSYVQLLPKISAMWHIGGMRRSNLYVSVAKGYKSGGFNTQMFSDVLQQRLMSLMGLGMNYDVDDIVSYRPEKSMNYEIGAHTECDNGRVATDVAIFLINCTDQQLTMFPDGTTTGRITTNAGRTRSVGGELAVTYKPSARWIFRGSYGFTDARFRKFFNGRTDYRGKRVPYAPQNTLFAAATYVLRPRHGWIDRIEASASVRGVGSICWNEENTSRQRFYAQPALSLSASHRQLSATLWCENLLDSRPNLFWFKSVGNEFVQRGNPRTFGLTLRVNFETGQPF